MHPPQLPQLQLNPLQRKLQFIIKTWAETYISLFAVALDKHP